MESIGNKISALRKGKGLSQEELASALYVSRQTVSKWERGQSLPDADNITAMCVFFGVSADGLLGCGTTAQQDSRPQNASPVKPAGKKLWLKILLISFVAFFAYLGLMAVVVFIFAVAGDDDPAIWTRLVPMVCVIVVIIFSTVVGIVFALHKKNKNPRE